MTGEGFGILYEDELCLVTPTEADSTWIALMQLGFIDHPDGHHYAIQLLEVNYAEQYRGIDRVPCSGYINQLSQILLPVSLGLGFTVIPRSSVDAFPYPERIQVAKLAVPVNEPVYLLAKKNRDLPSRYQLIKQLLIGQWQ